MTIQNVNPNKLHDELIKAGIIPICVTHDRIDGKITATNTWIEFADGTDMGVVQAVIDAHNPLSETPAQEIERLKNELEQTDYKIIKCSEYQFAGLSLPYGIQALYTERQVLRDQINQLEATLI